MLEMGESRQARVCVLGLGSGVTALAGDAHRRSRPLALTACRSPRGATRRHAGAASSRVLRRHASVDVATHAAPVGCQAVRAVRARVTLVWTPNP